jgi:dienelactone hydrolase
MLRRRSGALPRAVFVLPAQEGYMAVNPHRPQVYRKEAAEDAWKRCLAFFDKHLKA